jgi:hypothetical protein
LPRFIAHFGGLSQIATKEKPVARESAIGPLNAKAAD